MSFMPKIMGGGLVHQFGGGDKPKSQARPSALISQTATAPTKSLIGQVRN